MNGDSDLKQVSQQKKKKRPNIHQVDLMENKSKYRRKITSTAQHMIAQSLAKPHTVVIIQQAI